MDTGLDRSEFTQIDRLLFDRLLWGSLDPVSFRLRDGRSLTGQPSGVHRSGAIGSLNEAPKGRIDIDTAGGPVSISYEDIVGIE